ncbi:MAG TPA: PP2C family protein-serine/threonine phosphatase, partial [Anaerolineae bacterium]|nr:PP2C family protein-serine/threonine phosphatase [Anaerolineae bacterium]
GLLVQLGESLVRQDRMDEALGTWQQAIELYRAAGNLDGVARLYARAARAAWYADDTPRGLALSEEGLRVVAGAPESADQSRLLHEVARAYHFNGMSDRALPLVRHALDMARRHGAVDVEADALATLGVLPGVPKDEALAALHTAAELAREHDLRHIAGRIHHNLGLMTGSITGDLNAAREHFREAVRIARRRGVASEEALSCMTVFDVSMALGDLPGSEQALFRIRELIETIPDPETIRLEVDSMEANLYGVRGQWDRAVALQRRVAAGAERRGNLQRFLSAARGMAELALELDSLGIPIEPAQDRWSEAEAALERALAATLSGLGGRVFPLCTLSAIRSRQGRLDEARALIAEAEFHVPNATYAWNEQMLRRARAELAMAEGRWDEALVITEQIAAADQHYRLPWNRAGSLRQLADIHVRRGEPADLERAQHLLRQAREIYEEIGLDSYAALTHERIEMLRADTFARARAHSKIAQELVVAGRIQAGLLPRDTPHLPGWQLAATLEPASDMSGDFYDYIRLDDAPPEDVGAGDGLLALVVADVSDKGPGAALYMTLTRTLLRTYAAIHSGHPAAVLDDVNRRILHETDTGLFVTVFYAVLDPVGGTLTYANAGHNPPILQRASSSERYSGPEPASQDGVEWLPTTGMALGVVREATWREETVRIDRQDTLVIYTDGVIDAQSATGERFGTERLLAATLDSVAAGAANMQKAILTRIHAFVGDAPRYDDVTLLVIKRT